MSSSGVMDGMPPGLLSPAAFWFAVPPAPGAPPVPASAPTPSGGTRQGKQGGLGDNLYVGGIDLSGDVGSVGKISGNQQTLDVTGINRSGFERIGGRRDGGIDFSAYFNPSPGQAHPVLSALPYGDVIVSYFHIPGLGVPAASMVAKQMDYPGTRAANGAFTFSIQAQANGSGLEWGNQLTPGNLTYTSGITGANSTFEGGIGTWVATSNTTIAQTTAQAHSGARSLSLSSAAAGAMSAQHVTDNPSGQGGIRVTAGASYQVSGWFRSATVSRSCAMQVNWYDTTGAYLSTTTGAAITSLTTAWTQASSTHLAPAAAVYAVVLAQVVGMAAAAEVHYVDDVLFNPVSSPGSVDGGASSPYGLQAYLHVFSFAGNDVTVSLQDSPDNATFTSVGNSGFAQIAVSPQAQRIATPNNQTIGRYLRVLVTTVAGYTSLAFAVQVTRNQVANQVF